MHAVKNCLFVQEFYFCFCRVNIHIHRVGRELQMQHTGGELTYHHLVAVSFLQGRDEQPGFDRPVVDEEGLQGPAGSGIRRLGNEAG